MTIADDNPQPSRIRVVVANIGRRLYSKPTATHARISALGRALAAIRAITEGNDRNAEAFWDA